MNSRVVCKFLALPLPHCAVEDKHISEAIKLNCSIINWDDVGISLGCCRVK